MLPTVLQKLVDEFAGPTLEKLRGNLLEQMNSEAWVFDWLANLAHVPITGYIPSRRMTRFFWDQTIHRVRYG